MLKYLYKNDFIKLVIEEDIVGFYLIVYKLESEKSNEDYLIDSLDDAFLEAQDKFGISKEQWILQK